MKSNFTGVSGGTDVKRAEHLNPRPAEFGSQTVVLADIKKRLSSYSDSQFVSLSANQTMQKRSDQDPNSADTQVMTDRARDELRRTLSDMEDRMDKRVERIEKETDRRSEEFSKEISLRDETIRRELDLRRESFLAEQAIRDQAWEAKFSGFLSTQAERDKRLDESVSGIRADLTRLGSLKLNIWGAMLTAVGVGLAVAALSVSFYQTGKAEKPGVEVVKPATPSAAKSSS